MNTSSRASPTSASSSSSSLPARPTKGRPCRSSCWPGRLAHEHQVGVGVAGPEHHLGAGLVQRAPLAAASLVVERDQLLAALGGGTARACSAEA